jgi:CDP-diacylglycerol---serine O-phosphatidyltransferase
MAGTAKPRYITPMRSPFDLERTEARREARRQRFRAIPVRTLLPNMITLMALLALGAIVFAAALDGIDGRVARMIKGQSKFGAELDSLADFMNFGCAPALFLYLWGLHDLGNGGWIAAMVFAICGALRLARFNVMIDDPNKPAWAGNFFTGVPAPAGALVVLLPIYFNLLDLFKTPALLTLVYTLAIAFLMVSRLPVFSGKRVGKRVPPEMVLPVFVCVVGFFALLIAYPWWVLSIGTVAYLACLPLGWWRYRENERNYGAFGLPQTAADAATPGSAVPAPPPAADASLPEPADQPERPARLN